MFRSPIDLCRYQVINDYLGRIGLINSGGPSGENDLGQPVMTAVINKRAGGMGLISGESIPKTDERRDRAIAYDTRRLSL